MKQLMSKLISSRLRKSESSTQTDFYVKINHKPGRDPNKNKSLFGLAKHAIKNSGLPGFVVERLFKLLSPLDDSSVSVMSDYKVRDQIENSKGTQYNLYIVFNVDKAEIQIDVQKYVRRGGGVMI